MSEFELSEQMSSNERMLLEYEIRFWKQKALRAEQQRARAEDALKAAEALSDKYKDIPEEKLKEIVNQLMDAKVAYAKSEAEVYSKNIGPVNFRRLERTVSSIENHEAKVAFWKNVCHNYRSYIPVDDTDDTSE